MPNTHANYLLDLGQLLRGAALSAKHRAAAAPDRDFEQGRHSAYYEVLSVMHQQAIAFNLPLHDLSLDGLDPERDLL
jgi:hypothetical protein